MNIISFAASFLLGSITVFDSTQVEVKARAITENDSLISVVSVLGPPGDFRSQRGAVGVPYIRTSGKHVLWLYNELTVMIVVNNYGRVTFVYTRRE